MACKDVAALFRVTPPAVGLWARGGCPRSAEGRYDLTQVIAWRMERLRAELEELSGPPSASVEPWQAARAGKAELELVQVRG